MLHYRLLCLDSNVSPQALGVESNLLRIIHAGVKSGNLGILLHLSAHTHVQIHAALSPSQPPDCKSPFISATSDNHKYRTGGKGQPYISRQLSIHRIAKFTGFSFPDRSSKMSHDWENAPEPFGCIKSSCHQLFMETVLLTPCLKMLTRHDPDRVRMWVSGNKG